MSQPKERQQIINAAKAFAMHTRGIFGVLVAAFVIGVFALVTRDALQSHRKAQPLPPPAPEVRLDTKAIVRTAEGIDHQGRRVSFDILIFPRSVRWGPSSIDTLIINGRKVAVSAAAADLLTNDIREQITTAREIITAASADNNKTKTYAAQIAGKRAATLATFVKAHTAQAKPIYTLNLGRYHTPCARCDTKEVTWKGAVILVLVKKKQWRAAITEALKDAMSKRRNLPSAVRYSAFALVEHANTTTATTAQQP